jgi:predicted ATPase
VAELGAVVEAFERSTSAPSPVVVTATGPPGIGKSRLSREFLAAVRRRAGGPALVELSSAGADRPSYESTPPPSAVRPTDVRVLLLRSDAYGRSRALGLAADALCDLLHLARNASRAQVLNALAPYDLAHDEDGLLASLLSGQPLAADVGPQRARDVLYLVMTELVIKALGDGPCMFILEDAQWADPESVAWFDHLLARTKGQALFLVVLARPGFWKDDPHRFAARDHLRLELRPVGQRATREIARAVIGCAADDPKLEQVARQAAGSPLFAEELARVIAAGKPVAHVPTIEAAIQVSLDGLAAPAREALMHMAIFGLTGWDAGLTAIGVDDEVDALARLVEVDLLVEQQPSRVPGARQYLFKHALVRDVAYESVSESMREELHAKAAAWFAEIGEDAATIAEHYDRGGEHARAADYWETAARRALVANSLADAVKMADRALTFAERRETGFARATLLDEAYSRLDERSSERSEAIEAMDENAYDEACEVRTMGARARYDNARSAGVDVAGRLREVVRRSAELGLTDEQARSAATLATRYAYAGELSRAAEEADHLLALADERGVISAAVDAWQTLAVVHQTRGELAAALDARRNSAKAARSAGLKQREAMLTINLGFALTTIGAKAESRTAIEAGIRMAEEIGSAGTVRLGRMILLGWAAHFGADPSLDEALAEPRANADEAATGVWMVQDRVTLGVLFYRGCELLRESGAGLRRARALLRLSTEAYRATDNRDVLPVAMGYWAEADRRLGEVEQAEQIANEAAELVEGGAPSLLNEAIIFLALHSARVGLGDLSGARHAIERAMPLLLRRVRGLETTTYARDFLLGLEHNAQLLEAADAHGCVPPEIERMV